MIKRLFLTLFALLLPATAFASDLEGAWALQIDEAVIFRFDLEQSDNGDWRGTWTRPDSFGSNGAVFSRLEGSEKLTAMAALEFAGDVELSFDDPRPGAIPDIFRFRHIGPGRAQLTYVGTKLAPYPLIRVAPTTPLGPFAEGRVYDRDNAINVSDFEPSAGAPAPVPLEQWEAREPEPDQAEELEPIEEPEARSLLGDDFLDGL